MRNKIVSAAQAVALIGDGDTVAFSGFVGIGTPQTVIHALRERFDASATPCDLSFVFAAAG